MGRDLNQVNGRLERIENGLGSEESSTSSVALGELRQSFSDLQEDCHRLRLELHQEKIMRKQQLTQIDQHLSKMTQLPGKQASPMDSDELASQMAARIDARFREMMTHLQTELLQWKGQLDRDVQALREVKIDRKDVMQRFARIVSAAMADEDEPNPKDGFLL